MLQSSGQCCNGLPSPSARRYTEGAGKATTVVPCVVSALFAEDEHCDEHTEQEKDARVCLHGCRKRKMQRPVECKIGDNEAIGKEIEQETRKLVCKGR